jgi:SAM-dependent methyltransferase
MFDQRGYDVRRCHVCGLFFIDPYPDIEVVHRRVESYDYDELTLLSAETDHAVATRYYARHGPAILGACTGARSVLDIGCGTGRLLELLKGTCSDRVGIELNAERAEFARRVTGHEVHQVPFESFDPGRRFDVLTLINVLSHVASFDRFFAAAQSLLNSDGRIVLKVGEHAANVRKDAVFDWGIPDHLHFLGFPTLDVMARKHGFRIVRHDRVPFTEELFSRERWLSPGRSRIRDVVKRTVATTPGGLRALTWLYDKRHGNSSVSSLVVMSRSRPSG